VAARLDPQSLVAAKLAAQTFAIKPQPEEATMVKPPAGGWDRPAAQVAPTPAKPKTPARRGNAT
jgi:localization factor PodJL